MKKNIFKKNIFILYICILISSLQIIVGPSLKKIYKNLYDLNKSSVENYQNNEKFLSFYFKSNLYW